MTLEFSKDYTILSEADSSIQSSIEPKAIVSPARLSVRHISYTIL